VDQRGAKGKPKKTQDIRRNQVWASKHANTNKNTKSTSFKQHWFLYTNQHRKVYVWLSLVEIIAPKQFEVPSCTKWISVELNRFPKSLLRDQGGPFLTLVKPKRPPQMFLMCQTMLKKNVILEVHLNLWNSMDYWFPKGFRTTPRAQMLVRRFPMFLKSPKGHGWLWPTVRGRVVGAFPPRLSILCAL
jgi:hypothetical protein